MHKLLLFDIDGTMLQTHGTGRRAVERAIGEYLDRRIDSSHVRFSGKTDLQILREVLLNEGVDDTEADAAISHLAQRYQEIMHETLEPQRITVLPGVHTLVEHLHNEPNVQLAVLTGNLEAMARLKLEAADLSRYFPFGAFGSDSPHRDDLPAIAVQRAWHYTNRHFRGKDVIIIGDTEHDIRCGIGAGALCVGVCTGNYTRDDLAIHGPDVLLDDFSDYKHFLSAVLDG